MQASKAALTNFYETLRFELGDDVGITIATHAAIGSEMAGGKFMLEEGAEMQWKEEKEVYILYTFFFILYIYILMISSRAGNGDRKTGSGVCEADSVWSL